VPELKESFLQI